MGPQGVILKDKTDVALIWGQVSDAPFAQIYLAVIGDNETGDAT